MELIMLLCEEVKFKTIINANYNNNMNSDIIYDWMQNNKNNIFVQKLGNIWLKAIIRSERERFLFR